jgi:uncharacterized repeat protein (TIGR01451 family)
MDMHRHSSTARWSLIRLLAAAALSFSAGVADAEAQIVFRETFGSANAQLPTATSTADGDWTDASCLNGQIVAGGSPSDAPSTHFLLDFTHGADTGFPACTYAAGEAVWRTVAPIPVLPNTTYVFSYWSSQRSSSPPAVLTQVVTPNAGAITVNSTANPAWGSLNTWVQRTVSFTTGATTTAVDLRINNATIVGGGNDFGIDDISLTALTPSCNVSANGSFESPVISGEWVTSVSTLSGWTVVGGNVDLLRNYNNASDGAQSIDMFGTQAATIQQTFSGLTPGTTYSFSIDYSGISAASSRARVDLDNGAGFQALTTLGPVADAVVNPSFPASGTRFIATWNTYAFAFVASGTQATIRFVNTGHHAGTGTGLFLDNFLFGGQAPCEDFGDAPASYGTLAANNGARHAVGGPYLGAGLPDIDVNGQPNAVANGDDTTGGDEDGVTLPVFERGATATINVQVGSASSGTVLQGWVDWDGDGSFAQAGDHVIVNQPVVNGPNVFTVTAPATTTFGTTFARFRIADASGLAHEGAAASGEVEDYQATVDAEPPGGVFPTCPISQQPPATNFTIKQRWTTQDVAGRRTLPYQTPVVGDLFGTGQIVAVVPADNGFNWNATPNGPWAKDLHIVRGSDGAWLRTITTPHFNWFGHTAVAIADVTGDGQGEILMKASHNLIVPAAYRGRLVAYRNDGTELWVSNARYDYNNDEANTNNDRRSGHALSIADFNGDGVPEVFIGNQIFNARTGVRLAARPATDSAGCVVDCIQGATVAVDMDDDGLLELVAGNVVYKVTITAGAAGNTIAPWQTAQAVAGMGDGWTAVADIDLDGDPDVVVVRAPANNGVEPSRLFVWDGQTATVLGAFNLGLNALGGEPLIGDIDGDGSPEIVFVTVGQLNAFDFVPGNPPATALVKKWGVATNDASGMTSFALFDFNSDGNKELVYRDEQNVRIMNGSGATAVDLATFACTSGTRAEMPVIAALDGTREARILVTCGTAVNPQFQGVLRAFETASFPWATTRPVWNQQTYFVTHIENDLSVSSPQFPHWTSFSDAAQTCSTGVNRPLNAFQQQVTDLDRTTGCPVSCPLPANVSVDKTASSDIATAGGTVTYTILVTNSGPGNGPGTVVQDPFPAGIASAQWTCTAAGGAACPSPNSGGTVLPPLMVNETVTTLPPNGTLTYSITATVETSPPAEITNTASVTGPLVLCLPDGTNPPCDSPPSIVRRATADLTISKVSTPNPYVPGDPLAYTLVVSNLGPNDALGAAVQDTFPSLTAVTWTCAASGGATCSASGSGAINDTVNLPAGASLTYTATGMVPSALTGPLTNTATVTPPAGMLDPASGNNSAQDVNNALITADLRSSKAGAPNPFVPGETLTYTVVVSNAGPSDVTGARLQDALPPAFAGFTWACTPSAGAACGTASGVGNIDALVNLAAGSTATFTITGTVPSGYTSAADNSATVTPPPDTHDPTPGNNTSTYSNPPDLISDLAITKTQSPDPYLPGGVLTYTLQVSNLGPSDVANARVQDLVPGVMTGVSWACSAAGTGASCASASGMHYVDALVTLPVGTTATFTIAGTVRSNTTGVLTNTATVTAPSNVTDRNPGNNEATVNTAGAPESDLAIAKTASPDPYTPGAPLTYTIVVSNNGPSDAPNARVQDLFPAELSGFTWTCAPSSGGGACSVPSGQSLIDTFVDVPAGGSVVFTVTGTVPASLTGGLTNTASVTPPPGVTDPTPANNSSTSALGAAAIAEMSLTKTSSPNPYVDGAPITYTIVASNAGPSVLSGGRVQDNLPAVLQNITWMCAAVNGTCPAASGTGHVDALVDIDPGGTVTFTITADVPAGTRGRLTNAATILPPPGTEDPTPSNNSGVDFNPAAPIPGPADLQITQEAPGVAPPNGLLTFRLRTRNLGSNTALNPYVTGMIPPGTTFVSATPSAGGIVSAPDNPPPPDPATGYPIAGSAAVAPLKVTWPGLMKPGDTHTLEFTVRVAPGTPTGQILWSCWWTWSETEDPYHANNVVDAYLFVHDGTSPVGDLSIQAAAAVVSGSGASADQAGLETYEAIGSELPVRVGGTVKMRFWSTNAGPVATRGQYALILDEVAISVVDVTLPQGWVSPSGPSSAVWDTGVIQPGQTVNLDLTVRLNTTGAIKLFAQRITGSPGDPNASNEHAEIVLDGYGPGAAGRWVTVGNLDGAGAGEILTGAGQGETPQVRVYTGTGADTGLRFFAYERPFAGGVQIASCDVDGDGIAELITAPGQGRAPTIRVLSLVGGAVTELMAFDAFEAGFLGGASVACADLDADGAAELIVGAGPGRAPEVQVYNAGLNHLSLRATFLAYEAGFLGGVRVAAGVYAGRPGWLDAFAIATTPGTGRAAELRLWTPTGGPVAQVVVSSATKGVLPTLGDVNGDGQLDLLLAPDDGRPELVRIFEVDSGQVLGDVQGGLPAFPVGIRTAVGVLEGGPGQPEIVIGNGPGGHPRVRVIYWPPAGPVQRLEILPLEIP